MVVLTFQLWDIYIRMSHSPSCVNCIMSLLRNFKKTTVANSDNGDIDRDWDTGVAKCHHHHSSICVLNCVYVVHIV